MRGWWYAGWMRLICWCAAVVLALAPVARGGDPAHDARLAWWREARLGMFIHWGLYAIPGGAWGGKESYGEWVRHEAKIPREEYAKLATRFNPAGFDADAVVRAAKDAGMGYIVITTKHHDGFCLFDSALTDFDVMGTPFKRDVMKEMADACRKHGVRIGWYYSIMDWHHPDYVPRRDWEEDRPREGAEFSRYVSYMKGQLTELLTKYGEIGVLWFDGQWEGSWNDELGKEIEAHVRGLQPGIIINSRVGRGGGAYGLDGTRLGDYSTPEQFIPERDPGTDWETCMTMNRHWGYNAADKAFKPARELVRMATEIAGKGGNFLLNVGPTAEGAIPPESIERLKAMGEWMRARGVSVRGTRGSPFPPAVVGAGERARGWGACTMKAVKTPPARTRLYLHVWAWPADGRLVLPGLLSEVHSAGWEGELSGMIGIERAGDDVVLSIGPSGERGEGPWVVAVDVVGEPDVAVPPEIEAEADVFVDRLRVRARSAQRGVEVRFTLDGTEPVPASPVMGPEGVEVKASAEVRARAFRAGRAVGPAASRRVEKVAPRRTEMVSRAALEPGVVYEACTLAGDIKRVAEVAEGTPAGRGVAAGFDLSKRPREKNFGMRFGGYIDVPVTGVYRFWTASDDGSVLRIGGKVVVDNDEPHSVKEETGVIALEAGLHTITLEFFENWGGYELRVMWQPPGGMKGPVPGSVLWRPRAQP